MPSETLVEALMEVALPSDAEASIYIAVQPRPHAPRYRDRIGKDADTLLPILARFASPEVKREVLRLLRVEMATEKGKCVAVISKRQSKNYGSACHHPGAYEYDGKRYCGNHHPENVERVKQQAAERREMQEAYRRSLLAPEVPRG